MKHDINNDFALIFKKTINLMHYVVVPMIVYANIRVFIHWTKESGLGFAEALQLHIVGSLGAILIYVLMMGSVGLLISISNNLQRLVALQSGESETPSPVFHFNPRDVVTVVFILSIIGIIGYVAYLLLTGQFNATTD